MTITGYQQTGANDWIPTKEFNNVLDFVQNVSLTKGTHSFKMGAEYRQIKFPFFQVPRPARKHHLYRQMKPPFPQRIINRAIQWHQLSLAK